MDLTYPEAVRRMHNSPPASVFAVLRDLLHADGISSTLWLADYQLATLRSVDDLDGPERTADLQASDPGLVFASQRVAVDSEGGRVVARIPVSVRGSRLGVLELRGAGSIEARIDDFVAIADALGHELKVASCFTDHFERACRSRPLTVAAELQWSLLPVTAHDDARFTLAGVLEPAYSVAGDIFDWSCETDTLTIAVCDGMGRGVPAALATALCLTALRNARRAGVPLADQAALADQALYAHFSGRTFVATLLIEINLRDGTAKVIDAGSPRVLRVRDRSVELLELEAQMPLGMFEETRYIEQPFDLHPDDRLLIVSDGVHGAVGATMAFGDRGLLDAISASHLLSAREAVRHLIRALHDHRRDDLDDDAVVFCLDWLPPAD